MRPFTTLVALLAPLSALAQVQVNFYSDLNCQNYLGSEFGSSSGIGPTGGPAGSFSALYVTLPTCFDAPACSYFCETSDCSERTGGAGTRTGECWSYTQGVWVEAFCNGC